MKKIILVFIIGLLSLSASPAQNNPPVIDSIITPYNNQVFSYPNIIISVLASDPDNNLQLLEISVNNNNYFMNIYNKQNNNWARGIDLQPGINEIAIRAIDSSNLYSDVILLTVSYEITGAQNWIRQNIGKMSKINSVFFINKNVGWVAGDDGVILKTTNGGTDWVNQNSTISLNLNSIYFIDENTGWANGDGELINYNYLSPVLKTTNGGISWEVISFIEIQKSNQIYFSDNSYGWTIGLDFGSGKNIYKTSDGGITWEYDHIIKKINNGAKKGKKILGSFDEYFSLAIIDTTRWFVGVDHNHFRAFYRSNYGNLNFVYPDEYSRYYDVEFLDKKLGFLVAYKSLYPSYEIRRVESIYILKTTDGGFNWIADSIGIRGPILSADFIDENTGWLVGNYGIILHTTNGGDDWSIDGSVNGKTLNSVFFIDENTGWAVGDSGTILKYSRDVVPVELNTFSASFLNDEVTLNWTTSTEKNNKGFEIQRLQNSKITKLQDWEVVGFIPGNGTTTEEKSYTFIDKNLKSGSYTYRLKQIDYEGSFEYSKEVKVDINLLPTKFTLEQNYPNPFNPTTKIKYSIPIVETGHAPSVQLEIYDILGNEISTLVNEVQSPGNYEVTFNASNISNGIYFYKLQAGNFSSVKKMILLK